jgi:tetratricopeptide (TPR) repeat protein
MPPLAREVIDRAEALFEVGNFEAALVDFARAHELLQGDPRQWTVLHNLAVCHERLFHYDRALDLYAQYLREGHPSPANVRAVRAVLESLRGLLGTLRIDSNVRAEVWVDDRRMAEAPGTLRLPAGLHDIELRAHLHQAVRREVEVRPRVNARMQFELQRLSDYRGLPSAYFWSGAGLTAVALITGAALGASALEARTHGEAAAARAMQARTAEAERAERKVQQLSVGADIAFGAAALFAAGSAVLAFLTDWNGDVERLPPSAARPRASAPKPLGLRAGGVALALAGDFP